MKRVLVIPFYFPPEGGPGTQRCAKFAKYLPECGWQPLILTRAPATADGEWHAEDQSLLKDVGNNAKVIRVPARDEPRGWARQVPRIDIGRDWLEPAFEAAEALIAKTAIAAAVVSMSPFDLSYLGLRIRERLGVPVLFDLRDPWAIDGWRLRGSVGKWRADFKAMSETLIKADGVIANTAEAHLQLLNRFANLRPQQVVTIPNGFDEDDFHGCHAPAAHGDVFTIAHLGTLHCAELYRYSGVLGKIKKLRHHRPEPIDPTGRTPFYLLRAIKSLRERGHAMVEKIRVRLIGSDDADTRRCVNESGVADLVDIQGYVSHDQAINCLMQADVLFAPLHGLPAHRRSIIVPGKVYEYLRSGVPILGCLPAGDARDLVERSGGACCDPCDANQIAMTVERLFERWKLGELTAHKHPDWLKQYERRELTHTLADFLEQVVSGAHATSDASHERPLAMSANQS